MGANLAATAVEPSSIDETAKQLGRLVRRCRTARGMTQEEVATETAAARWGSASGVGPKSVMLLEGGRTDMMLDDLLKVLFVVGLDLMTPLAKRTPDDERLAARLVECREALKLARNAEPALSLQDVSDSSGVEPGQIGSIIRGEVVPRSKTYFALCRALGVDLTVGPTPGRRSFNLQETVDVEEIIAKGVSMLRAEMRKEAKMRSKRRARKSEGAMVAA